MNFGPGRHRTLDRLEVTYENCIFSIIADLHVILASASNQQNMCFSMKEPMTFSWISTEREKQIVLHASRLMRVRRVRLLRLIVNDG